VKYNGLKLHCRRAPRFRSCSGLHTHHKIYKLGGSLEYTPISFLLPFPKILITFSRLHICDGLCRENAIIQDCPIRDIALLRERNVGAVDEVF
jgi:hypothetical protein